MTGYWIIRMPYYWNGSWAGYAQLTRMSTRLSNVFDRPLHLELQPSRILLVGAGALYLLAACFWLQVSLPGRYVAVLYAGQLAHFLYLYFLHIANRLPAAVSTLGWDRKRGWWLQYVNGRRSEVSLCLPAFVSRCLVAVCFRTGRLRWRSVIVVADRLDVEAFRRLRLRLIQSSHGENT